MKIFATGDQNRLNELNEKIGTGHDLEFMEVPDETIFKGERWENYDLFIDLNLDDHPDRLHHYSSFSGKMVIGCAVKNSLAHLRFMLNGPLRCSLIGMNTLPTFINRQKMEASFLHSEDAERFHQVAAQLKWEFLTVQDRVGMVTPRVITMIINEACFTLQEGTASMDDIDKGMRLGTNYPYGPFEWCDLIGIKDIYETLEAIWSDTHDERYKICPLLKDKYLKKEKFY